MKMMILYNIVLFNKLFIRHLTNNYVILLNYNKILVKLAKKIILNNTKLKIMKNNFKNLKSKKELKELK